MNLTAFIISNYIKKALYLLKKLGVEFITLYSVFHKLGFNHAYSGHLLFHYFSSIFSEV